MKKKNQEILHPFKGPKEKKKGKPDSLAAEATTEQGERSIAFRYRQEGREAIGGTTAQKRNKSGKRAYFSSGGPMKARHISR